MVLSVLTFASCAFTTTTISKIPRNSFVKVVVDISGEHCFGESCTRKQIKSYASGSIVGYKNGALILTVEHVCRALILKKRDPSYEIIFRVMESRGTGIFHKAKVIKMDPEHDLCLLQSPTLYGIRPLMLGSKPAYGELVYNLASPVATAQRYATPFFDGYYSGNLEKWDMYTIPTQVGSSGSPIINKHGDLIGVLRAFHNGFNNVAYSPRFEDLEEFLENI